MFSHTNDSFYSTLAYMILFNMYYCQIVELLRKSIVTPHIFCYTIHKIIMGGVTSSYSNSNNHQ